MTGCSGVPVETVRVVVEAAKEESESGESVRLLKPVEKLPPVDMGETEKTAEAAVEPEKAPDEEAAPAPEEKAEAEPAIAAEPEEAPQAVAEPEKPEEPLEFDFGPEEKLPVELSADAFPFPDEKKDGEKTDA